MIPSVNRKEWRVLIMGSIEPTITSRLLKIKLSILHRKVKHGMISPKKAVEELFQDCKKHYDLYRQDIQSIFERKKEYIKHMQ